MQKVLFRYFLYVLLLAAIVIEMIYPLVGKEVHKTLGNIVLGAIVLHNLYNYRWYVRLFKGPYTVKRTIMAIVNSGMILAFLAMGIIIFLSPKLFGGGLGKMGIRILHQEFAYWFYFLMCIHIGLHVPTFIALGKVKFPQIYTGAGRILGRLIWMFLLGTGVYAGIEIPWAQLLFASPYSFPVYLEMSLMKAIVLHLGFSSLLITFGYILVAKLK